MRQCERMLRSVVLRDTVGGKVRRGAVRVEGGRGRVGLVWR